MKAEAELSNALAELLRPVLTQCFQEAAKNINLIPAAQVVAQPDELLTPAECAALLKVSKVSIWDWTKKGILIKHTIGNQPRYLRSEVFAAVLKKQPAE